MKKEEKIETYLGHWRRSKTPTSCRTAWRSSVSPTIETSQNMRPNSRLYLFLALSEKVKNARALPACLTDSGAPLLHSRAGSVSTTSLTSLHGLRPALVGAF